jgi:hypothetical protein
MSTWKKILLDGEAVADNLATGDLTQADEDRSYIIPNGRTLSFNTGSADDSIVLTGSNTGTDRKIKILSATPGNFLVDGGGTQPGTILLEAANNNIGVILSAPPVVTSGNDYTLRFPSTPGSTNEVLGISGVSGNILTTDWVAQSGGGSSTLLALTDTPSSFGTAGQFLAVNSSTNAVEFVDGPSTGTTVHYARMTMSSDVLRNGANAQDFNGTTDVDVEFDTQDLLVGTELTTNTTNHTVTVASDGFYRLTANMSFFSSSQRSTPAVLFNVNGSVIPGESIGYIRASTGSNEASGNISRVVQLSANDVVNVCCHDESTSSGSIFAEQATFEVEKLEVTINADFSNITNTPTTLSGYGITDSLQLGTTAGTALEGDTVIENNHLIGQKLEFETKDSAYSQGWEGTIVKFGTDVLTTNKWYVYTSTGWDGVDATIESKVKGLLGVALGTDADVDGLLVNGIYTSTSFSTFSAGDTLYISDTTAGSITNTAPADQSEYVRVVGYALGNNTIYVNPSPDYIELA